MVLKRNIKRNSIQYVHHRTSSHELCTVDNKIKSTGCTDNHNHFFFCHSRTLHSHLSIHPTGDQCMILKRDNRNKFFFLINLVYLTSLFKSTPYLLKSVAHLQHCADLFNTPHEQGEDTQNK